VPDHLAEGPGFESFGSEYVALAAGSVIATRVATATVDWFARPEVISVIIGGTGEALLATGMLMGCRLEVGFVEGTVRIDQVLSG
jgi:predicted aspartyl protease